MNTWGFRDQSGATKVYVTATTWFYARQFARQFLNDEKLTWFEAFPPTEQLCDGVPHVTLKWRGSDYNPRSNGTLRLEAEYAQEENAAGEGADPEVLGGDGELGADAGAAGDRAPEQGDLLRAGDEGRGPPPEAHLNGAPRGHGNGSPCSADHELASARGDVLSGPCDGEHGVEESGSTPSSKPRGRRRNGVR